MSKKDKLIKSFLHIPVKKDLTFNELETLLLSCGFQKLEGSGSAVKFYHQSRDLLISLHKPHPSNILKVYIVKQIRTIIEEVCNG